MHYQTCELRHKAHGKKEYTPEGPVDTITKGTYYLTSIDSMFRREYARKE
jgi:hydroxymethylglutaryl-CoA synthase